MSLIKQNPWLVLSLVQSLAGFRMLHLYKKQREDYKRLYSLTSYLVDMIEQHEIGFSDFDIIALGDLGVKVTIHEES